MMTPSLTRWAPGTGRPMSETVTAFVAIGNSDDKLTQEAWSGFITSTDAIVEDWANEVHGRWYSLPDSRYQNACWCFEVRTDMLPSLRDRLALSTDIWGQESIALTIGTTEFIKAVP